MANPDAPWGFSDLRNSVDSELVASAETATEAYPDGAGNRDDSGSARYYGRYGRSVENKEEPTYYYLGKRSSNAESHLLRPIPYYSKRSADAVDTAAKDNVSYSYNRNSYYYAHPYAYGYGYGYPLTYGYGYRKRSADAEPETKADASMSHYYFGRSNGYPYGYGLGYGKRSADAKPPTNAKTVTIPHYYIVPYGYPIPIGRPNVLIGKRSTDAEPENPLETVAKDNTFPMYTAPAAGYAYRPYGKHSADAEPQPQIDAYARKTGYYFA
jgi:hypothetical protein